MDSDYHFGNKYYKYFDNKVGVQSTYYKILAPEQSQEKQPGIE